MRPFLTRTSNLAITALFLAASPAATAHETLLYAIDFSAPKHSLSVPPALGGIDGISKIKFGNPRVVSGFGPLNDRPLLFTGNGLPYDQIELNGDPESTVYQVDFDVVTENLKGSGFRFTVFFDSPTANQFSLDGTVNTISILNGPTWEEGQSIHFSVRLDYLTNLWSAEMDNVRIFESSFDGSALHSIRFSLGPKSLDSPGNGNIKVALDNIRVSTSHPQSLNPPASFSAEGDSGRGSIDLRWEKVPGARTYLVYRSEFDSFPSADLLTETDALSFSDRNILPGKTYHYMIKSRSGDLLSVYRKSDGATVYLRPPATLSAETTSNQNEIRLTWPGAPLATIYLIYRSETESTAPGRLLGSTSTLSFIDATTSPGIRYYYSVRSANGLSRSAGVVSSDPLIALPGVSGLRATANLDGKVGLAWDHVDGAYLYTIFRGATEYFDDSTLLDMTFEDDYSDQTSINGDVYFYWVVSQALNGSIGAEAESVIGGSIDPSPDLWIHSEKNFDMGRDIVNSTGIGQTSTAVARNREGIEREIQISWRGEKAEEIALRGTPGNRLLTIRYLSGGNVTAHVMTGRFTVPPTAAPSRLKVLIKPSSRLRRSAREVSTTILIRGSATQSPVLRDSVFLHMLSLPVVKSVREGDRPDPTARR